jgi:hypothetical protein
MLASPKNKPAVVLKWFHLAALIVWIGLVPFGVTIWKESIVFIIICSLYANIEASFSAYQAARAETKEEEEEE